MIQRVWIRFASSFLISTASALSMSANRVTYDLVVIGGGAAGLTAAKFAATFKKKVVLIEKEKLGGDCTWTGCVPSKSLIASAKAAHTARNAKKYGITTSNVKADMKAVRDRLRANIDKIYQEDDSPEAMVSLGIDTIIGNAEFSSKDTVRVQDQTGRETVVEAKQGIVLATGAKPRRPTDTIPGLDSTNYVTYEEIFDLDKLPKTLTVVGGGPIGCELAQCFARFGSKVTQVANRLVPKEDMAVSRILEEVFEDEGIKLVRGSLTEVAADGEGHVAKCSLEDGTSTTVKGDLMLVAVGRIPNVNGMRLKEIGIKINDRGGICVDKKLQTSVAKVYAAGDCTGDKQFTHYAGYQGAIAARNILLPLSDAGIMECVPAATFTSPEIASVGLLEDAAKAEFGDEAVRVSVTHLSDVDRAVCDGEERGLLKIVYLKKNLRIVGATIMCPSAGEMISQISLAMKASLTFDQLATVMLAYPAYSVAVQLMAADVYYKKTVKSKPLYEFLKRLGL